MAWLVSIVICLFISEPAGAQQGNTALQQAIALSDSGDWDKAVIELHRLIEEGRLSEDERSEARKYLALTYIKLEQEDKAVEVFKTIVRDDPKFDMNSMVSDRAPVVVSRNFSRALVQVRQEEIEARKALLSKTSRGAALLRSAVLPGWGQRYQDYNNRGYMMAGMIVASISLCGGGRSGIPEGTRRL